MSNGFQRTGRFGKVPEGLVHPECGRRDGDLNGVTPARGSAGTADLPDAPGAAAKVAFGWRVRAEARRERKALTMTDPDFNTRDDQSRLDDPLEGIDILKWIMSIDLRPPREVVPERTIRQWLEAAGFAQIDLRPVPERGHDCWQAVMDRGTNRDCPTGLAAEAMLHRLAADLGCRIQGAVSALAWGDQIGVGFRLGPGA
jgi:hypothetical protein